MKFFLWIVALAIAIAGVQGCAHIEHTDDVFTTVCQHIDCDVDTDVCAMNYDVKFVPTEAEAGKNATIYINGAAKTVTTKFKEFYNWNIVCPFPYGPWKNCSLTVHQGMTDLSLDIQMLVMTVASIVFLIVSSNRVYMTIKYGNVKKYKKSGAKKSYQLLFYTEGGRVTFGYWIGFISMFLYCLDYEGYYNRIDYRFLYVLDLYRTNFAICVLIQSMFGWAAILGAKGAKTHISTKLKVLRNLNVFSVFSGYIPLFLELYFVPGDAYHGVMNGFWSALKLLNIAVNLTIVTIGTTAYGIKVAMALGGLKVIKEKSTTGTAAEKTRYKNVMKIINVVGKAFILACLAVFYCLSNGIARVNSCYYSWPVPNYGYWISLSQQLQVLAMIQMFFSISPPFDDEYRSKGIFSIMRSKASSTASKYGSSKASAASSAADKSSVASKMVSPSGISMASEKASTLEDDDMDI